MWFGIAQWFGLQSNIALNYVLPNMNNFGCRLYSETDLYKEGTGECGMLRCVYIFSQKFIHIDDSMSPQDRYPGVEATSCKFVDGLFLAAAQSF
jgi:hypothetical protein